MLVRALCEWWDLQSWPRLDARYSAVQPEPFERVRLTRELSRSERDTLLSPVFVKGLLIMGPI